MIPDADRITHMLEAISKMRISLGGMSKSEFLADDKKAVAGDAFFMRVKVK